MSSGNRSGLNTISRDSRGASSTSRPNSMAPIRPVSRPRTVLPVAFTASADTVRRAALSAGTARSVITAG